MSLKAFHIFFIAVSTLLASGLAIWALRFFLAEGGSGYLWLGILGLVAAVGLVVYGNWFLKKTKDVGYL